MKINIEKLDKFLMNETFDQKIRDFVLKIIKEAQKEDYLIEYLLSLDFITIEEDDNVESDWIVIDFFKINLIKSLELKIFIIEVLEKYLIQSQGSESFLIDSKILI